MGIAVELLPCPSCMGLTRAPLVQQGVEVVHWEGCGKLLRRRRALTNEQRVRALALQWAAPQIENDRWSSWCEAAQENRGELDELYARSKLAAADQLHEWARTIHKRPPISESDGS